jgi:acyl carrier protein
MNVEAAPVEARLHTEKHQTPWLSRRSRSSLLAPRSLAYQRHADVSLHPLLPNLRCGRGAFAASDPGERLVDVTRELEQFILTELVTDGGVTSLAPDDDLLELGIVDSLGIIQLVAHLEQKFGIQVSDDELVPSNFHTLRDLARFVEDKKGAQA